MHVKQTIEAMRTRSPRYGILSGSSLGPGYQLLQWLSFPSLTPVLLLLRPYTR